MNLLNVKIDNLTQKARLNQKKSNKKPKNEQFQSNSENKKPRKLATAAKRLGATTLVALGVTPIFNYSQGEIHKSGLHKYSISTSCNTQFCQELEKFGIKTELSQNIEFGNQLEVQHLLNGNPNSKTVMIIFQGSGADNTAKYANLHTEVLENDYRSTYKMEFNDVHSDPKKTAEIINSSFKNLEYSPENPALLTLNGTSMGGSIAIAVTHELAKIPASERSVVVEYIIQDSTPTHFDNITIASSRVLSKNHRLLSFLPQNTSTVLQDFITDPTIRAGTVGYNEVPMAFIAEQLEVAEDVQNNKYPITNLQQLVFDSSGEKNNDSPDSINFDTPEIYYIGTKNDFLVDAQESFNYIKKTLGDYTTVKYISVDGAGHAGGSDHKDVVGLGFNPMPIYDNALDQIGDDINSQK